MNVRDRRPYRRFAASRAIGIAVILVTVLAACGGSDAADEVDSPLRDGSAITGATTDTTVPPPETSAAPTTTDAVTGTEPVAAALIPEVVCVDEDSLGPDVVFAVVNESSEAVVVDARDSVFENAMPTSLELEPRVFAPGRTSPVYWAVPDTDAPVVWNLTGPDGVTRTAKSDDAIQACTPELIAATTPDTRSPALEIGEPTLASSGDAVTFVSEVVGVPEMSVCAAGLEPRPVRIVSDDAGSIDEITVDGPRAEWNVPLFPNPDDAPGRFGRQSVAALVLDQCAAGDVVQSVWRDGPFYELYDGVLVCVAEDGDGVLTLTTDADDPECRSGLPGTGGSRVRPS